jgi:hypothetical protein
MLNFMSAIVGITVGLAGGALADLSEIHALEVPHIYTFTYLLAALLCLAGGIIAVRIHDPGSLSIRETAMVFLSVKNIRAYLDIYQLDVTEDQKKRESSMLSLEQSDAPVATEQMQMRLKSPLPWEKERILRSLSTYPRDELLDDIIREAQDPHSYNRRDAIYTLGSYNSRKSARALRSFTEDENPEVAAAALRSLGRIGRQTDLRDVYRILEDPQAVGRAEIDALRALSLMDEDGQYVRSIFSLVPRGKGRRFQQLAFILCARSFTFSPPLSDYFMMENQAPFRGYNELISEAQLIPAFLNESQLLVDHYRSERLGDIWKWCSARVREMNTEEGYRHLRDAIVEFPPGEYSKTNTIAVTYFTYQLLKPVEEDD